MATHGGGETAAGAAQEEPGVATGADQTALDGSAVLSADPEAVVRIAKQWDEVVDDLRGVLREAKRLAGVRPLQHDKADETWKKFHGQWGPNAQMLPESLEQFAASLQSIPDNLRAMAKDDAATEERNIDAAQHLGRAVRE